MTELPAIPDSALVAEATELVRAAASPLIYHQLPPRLLLRRAARGGVRPELPLRLRHVPRPGPDPALPLRQPAFRDRRRRQILAAFTEGIRDRPDTTFGNVKADVPAHCVPGFRRGDFVEAVQNPTWSE